MQIHELNNFTGTLGSGAYLAIDDGTDTGKISSQGLLAATEARIDNIIAGPAPSAEEIVDARLGADGVTYPSLGDAIRDQFTDVKSDIIKNIYLRKNVSFLEDSSTAVTLTTTTGKRVDSDGSEVSETGYNIATFTADASKVYKLSIQTGTKYASTRIIEFVSDGVTYYKIPTDNSIVTWYLTNFSGQVKLSYRAVNANSLKVIEQTIENDNSYTSFRDGFIDPDDYTGSDSAKIEAAMQAIGDNNHGTIIIKRKYTLTSSISIKHLASATAKITFLGIGANCGFNMGAFRFKAYDSNASYGAITFENIYFEGTSILFASGYLIRMNFINCVFNGGSNVVSNYRYMQSWSFSNCLFRNFTGYIIVSYDTDEDTGISPALYDIQFNECLIESSAGFIYAYFVRGVSVVQCCIEGLWGRVCFIRKEARQLNFTHNYFEHNNNRYSPSEYDPEAPNDGYEGGRYGVHFDFSYLINNLSEIVIANNNFIQSVYAPDEYNTLILLPNSRPKIGYITIENNFVSYASNMYLVKTHDSTTYVYDNVILRNNLNAYYKDDQKVLVSQNHISNAIVHELENGDDLNDLYMAGIYHAESGITTLHSPSEDEYFVIIFGNTDINVQLAITQSGIKTRLGAGAWT